MIWKWSHIYMAPFSLLQATVAVHQYSALFFSIKHFIYLTNCSNMQVFGQ